MSALTLSALRRFAVARTFFLSPDLQHALDTFGFVQADPIRAPARAQDLTLRHRLARYQAGELEQRYDTLQVEEDVFVNYGFLSPVVHGLMHPRGGGAFPAARRKQAAAVLAFVREHGAVHPRQVDQHFAPGRVTNYWGGSSSATTHLLEQMHYRGLLRVVRREFGVRIYGAREPFDTTLRVEPDRRLDALVAVVVEKYAPLPAATLSSLVLRLRWAAPQWSTRIRSALVRARQRLAHARIDGVDWYWPPNGDASGHEPPVVVRLLAPFDPLVWDRRRFELFWGWAYRFEAYTPVAKRKLGYYALPLLWRDEVVGWANVSAENGSLAVAVGYVKGSAPRQSGFRNALAEEVERMRIFLGAESARQRGVE